MSKLQTYSILAPYEGMNLRDPQNRIAESQAFKIKNYYPYQAALRARGAETSEDTVVNPQSLHNWVKSDGTEVLLVTAATVTNGSIFSYDSSFTQTDITGAVVISSGAPASQTQSFILGDYIFLINLNNGEDVIRVDRSNTASLAAFTGPGGDDKLLFQGWNYKGRPYFIEGAADAPKVDAATTSYWYHQTLGAVTGALTEVDLKDILEKEGHLLFGTSWSFTDTFSTQEVCVFVTTVGEVLVYGGSHPNGTDWQLITRIVIPRPLGRKAYLNVGNELIIITTEGLVFLSQALNQGGTPSTLNTGSDLIRKHFERGGYFDLTNADLSAADGNHLVLNRDEPFLYLASAVGPLVDTNNPLFVLNLRSGAWSYIDLDHAFDASPPTAFAFGKVVRGVPADDDLISIDVDSTTGANRFYQSGWFNLGSARQTKNISGVRLFAANTASGTSSSVTYTLRINTQFKEPASAPDTNAIEKTGDGTGSNSTEEIQIIDFNISITGVWFQFKISATGGGMDEVTGFDIDYTTGDL